MDITELGVRVVSRGAVQELDALEHASDRAGHAGERMVSIFESVKRKLEVLGIAFGIRELLKMANEVREAADQYEKLGAVAQRVGAIHGITAKDILTVEQALRAQDASMIDARNTTVSLLTADIDLSNATKLLGVAQDIAASTNLSETEAMNDLILAMQTGMDRTLKHAGVQLDLAKAVDRTAASLGVSTSQLSQHRIEQIRLNAILQAATQIEGAHAASLTTAAGRAEEAHKVFQDLKLIIGTLISNAVTGTLETFAGMLRGIRDWVRDDTEEFIKFVDAMKAIAVGIGLAGAAWVLYTGYAKGAAAITAIIAASETVVAFFELAKGIRSMADAMALFELAAAPVLVVIAAIGAVVAYKFFSKEIKSQVEEFTRSVFGLGAALKTVGGGGADGTDGIQSSTAALQRLADMRKEFPGVIQGLLDIATATRTGSDETTKETERQASLTDAITKATKGLVGQDAAMAANLETTKAHAQWSAEDAARIRDQTRAMQDQVTDAEHQVRALGLVGRALEEQNIRWKEAKAVQDAYRSGFDVEARVNAAHRVAAAEMEVLDVSRKQLAVRNLLAGAETAFTSFWSDLATKGVAAFQNLASTVKSIFGGVVADIAKQFFELNILPKLASLFGLNASSTQASAQNVAAGVIMQQASVTMLAAANIMAGNPMAGAGGAPGAGQLPPARTTGGGHSWMQGAGVAAAGFGVGYGVGSMTTNRTVGALGGAASGAATGAMLGSVLPGVGTAVGAVIGGITGFVGGLMGAGKAAHDAARQLEEARAALKVTMAAFAAAVGRDALGAALAQAQAGEDARRKQINDALPGKKNEAERNAELAKDAALYAQQVAQIKKDYEDQKRFAQQDLQVRMLRAQGRTQEADDLAFATQQQQEYAQAVKDGADATYLAMLTQVQAAEKVAHAMGTLQDAVRNAPTAFRIDPYVYQFQTPLTKPPGYPTDSGAPISNLPASQGAQSSGPVTITFQKGSIVVDGTRSAQETVDTLVDHLDSKLASTLGLGGSRSQVLDRLR